MIKPSVSELPNHPQVSCFSRRIHRTQHMVVFMALTYYQESIPNKINKGKRHMGRIYRKPGMRAKSPLPGESHRTYLSPPARIYNNMGEVLSAREVHGGSLPRVFVGDWLHRPPVPNIYQDSSLSEDHVFSINFIVCKSSVDTGSCYQGRLGTLLKLKFPDAS